MRPPSFWYLPRSLRATMLSPIGAIYAKATAWRVRKVPSFRADVPVICIGNINAGGTGKTPTAIAVTQRLIDVGETPHIVSRGYGGLATGPVQVDLGIHRADQVGDEPLMLAAFAPTWVAKDRAAGVAAAQAAGASVILLDDGHQNPAVHKDLSIVVVDAIKGFGNGRVIPAGPLREHVNAGLDRAEILLSIGPDAARDTFNPALPPTCARMNGRLDPLPTGMPWAGQRVLAFAGIGHPEKFFATLKSLGANVVQSVALDDHQVLGDALLARLDAEARKDGLTLVTTEKDAMRLPDAFRARVSVLPVRLTILDWGPLDERLCALGLTSK